MTGYQELVTDPSYAEQILCFTAPMVGNYGVAEGRSESAGAHVQRRRHARGAGPGVDGLAARARRRRARRDRHALARPAPARPRRDGRGDRAGTRRRRGARRSRAGRDGGPGARRAASRRASPYVYADARPAARRGRRLRDEALDPPAARRRGRGGRRSIPHDVDADELAGYDGVVLSNGPGDPEPLDEETAVVRDLLGRVPVLRHLPRPPAARRSPPATRPSSSRSATAARTTRCSSARRAACSSPPRTTASRSKPTDEAEATAVSLYDGTVEGFDFPELNARSVQFHPEAGPGPARRLAAARDLGRGAARCPGALTSSRSA